MYIVVQTLGKHCVAVASHSIYVTEACVRLDCQQKTLKIIY